MLLQPAVVFAVMADKFRKLAKTVKKKKRLLLMQTKCQQALQVEACLQSLRRTVAKVRKVLFE